MTLVDDRILEYIDENEVGSPTKMQREARLRFTPEYVAKRCRVLAEYGLLRPLGNGVYSITKDGERYLDGDLDTEELDHEGDEENGERRASA